MPNENLRPNENLKAALRRSGLTPEELAAIIGVDPKTVQRWLAGRNPYARLRAKAAAALDTAEHELWPDVVAPPPPAARDAEPAGRAGTDTIAGFSHANDPDAPEPATLLQDAEQIEILIPTATELIEPGVLELLISTSSNGGEVRVLVEDPDHTLAPLLDHDAIEVHALPAGADHGLWRADDQMLLVLRRIGVLTESPPLIHLARRTAGGLFDRLADDYEQYWAQSTPLRTREDLRAYLVDTDLGDELDDTPAAGAVAPASQPSPGSTIDPEQRTGRFWPRRPS